METVDGEPCLHVEFEAAIGVHVLPDQRRQGAEISHGESPRPLLLRQYLLQHEGIDVDHAVLEKMQSEHADLVILTAIADHLPAAREEDEVVGAVPLFDDVQALVDLAAKWLAVQVSAQEDGLHRPAELRESPVGRMLNVAPHESAQDRFRLGRAEPNERAVTYLTIWSYCCRMSSQSIGFVRIA